MFECIFLYISSPPDGCLQWSTEPTGQIRSFNNAQTKQMLPNQEYQICIRQDDTSCCIEYQVQLKFFYITY